MNTVTFAYVESNLHARDIRAALADKISPVITFTLDCSVLDPAVFTGPSFTQQLADNSKWQLYARKRRTQQITTKPNLLLSGQKMTIGSDKGLFLTYRDLIVKWYWARGLWIYTGKYDLAANDPTIENLVKVIRGQDDISFQSFNGIRWALQAQISVETEAAE